MYRVGKKFILTLLLLLLRRLFSLDGGTKPLCGGSLGVSSSPQGRKCTSQITYNFLVRQNDLRTPKRILAVTAAMTRLAGPKALPHAFLQGLALGCDRLRVPKHHFTVICIH